MIDECTGYCLSSDSNVLVGLHKNQEHVFCLGLYTSAKNVLLVFVEALDLLGSLQ